MNEAKIMIIKTVKGWTVCVHQNVAIKVACVLRERPGTPGWSIARRKYFLRGPTEGFLKQHSPEIQHRVRPFRLVGPFSGGVEAVLELASDPRTKPILDSVVYVCDTDRLVVVDSFAEVLGLGPDHFVNPDRSTDRSDPLRQNPQKERPSPALARICEKRATSLMGEDSKTEEPEHVLDGFGMKVHPVTLQPIDTWVDFSKTVL